MIKHLSLCGSLNSNLVSYVSLKRNNLKFPQYIISYYLIVYNLFSTYINMSSPKVLEKLVAGKLKKIVIEELQNLENLEKLK